ncbi:MAG TPA: glycosyltransferase family 39 protein [Bacteroidia bacterium]|nr:glycosyltransferase family 39 protein [Bacteroidia bacterium]
MKFRFTPGVFLGILFIITFVLHFRVFKMDILGTHAWRQTYTQANIDCFYEEDNSIFHPRYLARGSGDGIRAQEFPVMQWTVAQTYFVFGQSILTTRVVCFIMGLLSVWGFFLLLQLLTKNRATIYAGATMFTFSPLFYYYMINPLPDLLALCAAVWCMYFYVRADQQKKFWLFAAATACLSVATLAKLPYIMFAGIPIGLMVIYLRNKGMKPAGYFLLISGLLMIPALAWYISVLPEMQANAVLAGIFSSSPDSRPILDALVGNITDSLPELFLGYTALPFFLVGLYLLFRYRAKLRRQYLPFVLAGILFLLYFFYEINLISTVHDYYMMPFLPLLFLIAAWGWQYIFSFEKKVIRFIAIALVVATPLTAFLKIDSRWNVNDPGFPIYWYTQRDQLRAAVPDSSLVIMGNDFTMCILPYYIHKRGWTYVDSEMQRYNVECLIKEGAEYLYTNSEVTLNDTTLRPLFRREVGVYEGMHVFELKKPAGEGEWK